MELSQCPVVGSQLSVSLDPIFAITMYSSSPWNKSICAFLWSTKSVRVGNTFVDLQRINKVLLIYLECNFWKQEMAKTSEDLHSRRHMSKLEKRTNLRLSKKEESRFI